jgi:hypothetical protein
MSSDEKQNMTKEELAKKTKELMEKIVEKEITGNIIEEKILQDEKVTDVNNNISLKEEGLDKQELERIKKDVAKKKKKIKKKIIVKDRQEKEKRKRRIKNKQARRSRKK